MRTNPQLSRRALLAAVAPSLATFRTAIAQDSVPGASPVPDASLSDQISAMLAGCNSIFGIVIIDAGGEMVFEHNLDLPFASASLYKLVLIADILLRIEGGELALEDEVTILDEFFILENGVDSFFDLAAIGQQATVEELLYSAGSYSSNTGAQALISLTTVEALDARAVELGMMSTFYRLSSEEAADLYAPEPGAEESQEYARALRFIQSFAADGIVNVTTPGDVGRLLLSLSNDELGSPLTSWRFKQVLSARVINDRLPALLPMGTAVLSKTGNLPGVLHDVGIIETPGGSVVAVAMAQAVTDLDRTMWIEQRIGLVAYETGLP